MTSSPVSTCVRLLDGTWVVYERHGTFVHSTGGNEPDRSWRHTDSHGHEHSWRRDNPTFREVRTDEEPCDTCRDVHDWHDHYECVQCGEHVEPGVKFIVPEPVWVASYSEAYREGTVLITSEEARHMVGDPSITDLTIGSSSVAADRQVVKFRQNLTPEEAKALMQDALAGRA